MSHLNSLFSLWTFCLIWVSSHFLHGQVVTTIPQFPVHNQEVTIIFDAAQGNGALANCNCTVYAHTGVITNLSPTPTSWRYVIGNWATDDTRVRMTSLGDNKYSLTYNIRNFHNVPANERILRMAFVFRNLNGSIVGRNTDGSDIFIDVFDNPNQLAISIIQPDRSPRISQIGEHVPIRLATSIPADWNILLNGTPWFTGSEISSLDTFFEPSTAGSYLFEFEATIESQTANASFRVVVLEDAPIKEVPAETLLGFNQIHEDTLRFLLQAPGKQQVMIIGSFNDWTPGPEHQMNKSPDGEYFWIDIVDFDRDKPFLYQYVVDAQLTIADPLSILVLDPAHDQFIPSSVYRDIPAYPTGKTSGIVSYIPLEEQPYEWQQATFIRPDEEDLVIYELLIRDFGEQHSYRMLIDTLDYLKGLGVNAIELMPIQEFEGNISWGYNPNFHMALDKYYGTRNDLKAFVDAAHAKGIAVIVDVVYNHAFSQSPLCQLYWDPVLFRPTPDNPWLNPTDRHPFSVGYDFNHESKATQDWLDRVMEYWIREFRLDGFRFDLSKGFTQRFSSTVEAWSRYDASRIALLKRLSGVIRDIDPSFYIILEHFAENSEEQELAEAGMMLWGNMNHEYNEATMGYNSDFRWADYKRRNFAAPKLITYMESHDEERLMFKNMRFGNSSATHNTRDFATALQRVEAASVFHYTIPGPKMLWQFGELGYDFSINHCPNGQIDEACRTSPKPIRWDYIDDPLRKKVYWVTGDLAYLKTVEQLFKTEVYDYNLSSRVKRIRLDAPSGRTVAIANFDVNSGTIQSNFHQEGWWYEYFSGDSIFVSNRMMVINLQPGEYRLYTDRKIKRPSLEFTTSLVPAAPVKGAVQVYPNPGNHQIIVHSPDKSIYSISLIGLDGVLYHQARFDGCVEDCIAELPLNLASGTYLLFIETEVEVIPVKWIKQ